MHGLTLLRDLLLLIAVAIPVVAAAHRLRVPSVVGFLLTGMAIGPRALGLIGHADSVQGLAELGIVLLLFTIGLELSIARIVRLGRVVLQGGGTQVLGTMAAVIATALAMQLPIRGAVLYGAMLALSSTAIVLKVYTDRGELDSVHGRVVVGILTFQDLCVVPLMLLVQLLAGGGEGLGAALPRVGLGLATVAGMVAIGRLAVPWLLERITLLDNRELFTLTIAFVGLGAAWATSSVGLSLALGAFIAGLVISESEYGAQAFSDVLPFRDTFSGIFFISVGMLLDLGFVARNATLVLSVTAALLLGKALVAAIATRLLGYPLETSVRSGLALAQVGEFSFILAGVAAPLGLMKPDSYQVFLGASVLSMLASPFVIAGAGPIAELAYRMLGRRPPELPPGVDEASPLNDHVVIVGYGVNGRNLARVLKAAGIPYVILEQSGLVFRRARLDGQPAVFGDGTRHEVLVRVGLPRARVLVFAIASVGDETRGVELARRMAPHVRILVRTRRVAAIEQLHARGADEVVPEEFETSLEIFARVLRMYGVPSNTIQRQVESVRGEQYGMLRGLRLPDLRLDALRHLGVHRAVDTVEVEAGSEAVGQSPRTLNLRRRTGANVIAVVREGQVFYTPDPVFGFQPGDMVVLAGARDAMDRAGGLFRAAAAAARRDA